MYFMIDCAAASGDEPGAAIFMLVFFIKLCFIAVGAEQNVRHPSRGSAHLLTDSFQVNIGAAFDDQLIVNVPDGEFSWRNRGCHG